jgi:competence protein ComEA
MYNEPSRWERWGLIGAFVVTCLFTVGGIAAVLSNRPQPVTFVIEPPPPTVTPVPTATPAPVVVYVTGAVARPNQMVTLAAGSRVGDVVQAVGGFAADADLSSVNLAAVVRDGQQIHVSILGEAPALAVVGGGVSAGLIDVNTADVDTLVRLPGIGPALAGRIVAYREANGPFGSMADLDKVSGIGPSILAQIEGMVTFGTP